MTLTATSCGPTRQRCTAGMTWEERVIATGWDVTESGCWEWRGERAAHGRAKIGTHATRKLAYRVTYEINNGPIPEGLVACHTCDNPSCVNPDHIMPGTQLDNMRMVTKRANQKLDGKDHARIRALYATGHITLTELSRAFLVDPKTIQRAVKGRR